MKHTIWLLKLPITCLLLLAASFLAAQNCYQTFMEEGKSAFNEFQFDTAIKKFKAAKFCSDKPENSDADDWIAKTQNGYIINLRQIAARYLTSEARNAKGAENNRLAFRLCQEALKMQEDHEPALELQKKIFSYLSDAQFTIPIEPVLYDPVQVYLPKNKLIILYREGDDDKEDYLQLVDSESMALKFEIEIKGSLKSFQFSLDEKWLVLEYFDPQKSSNFLEVRDVQNQNLVKRIENSFSGSLLQPYDFSENSRRLIYKTNKVLSGEGFHITGSSVTDNRTPKAGYDLQVYDLISQKEVFRQENIIDLYCELIGDTEIARLKDNFVSQEFLNEKVQSKFSIEGKIAANSQNFVKKANEFSIRQQKDFAISPDGTKVAHYSYAYQPTTAIDLTAEPQVNFGAKPTVFKASLEVYDIGKGEPVKSFHSIFKVRPQQLPPFAFDKRSNRLAFVNNLETNAISFSPDGKMKSEGVSYPAQFNVYDFEKGTYLFENEQDIFDFNITDKNVLVTWKDFGELNVYDLNRNAALLKTSLENDFSHYYDVFSKGDLLYFSTFRKADNQTVLNVYNLKTGEQFKNPAEGQLTGITYRRWHPDTDKVATLSENARTIFIEEAQGGKKLLQLKFNNPIEEYDFSKDGNFLIARDENNLVKILSLKEKNDLDSYYDQHLKPLTKEEKEAYGIN